MENYQFSLPSIKKISLVLLFLFITPLALFTSISTLSRFVTSKNLHETAKNPITSGSLNSGVSVFASLPADVPSVGGQVLGADSRVEMIRQYLEYYNSPLEDYADLIVKTADENGLDYRLTTAIAQQESNLCKKIPAESHNCWGWGIHSEGTLGFSSYEEGIKTVTKGIKDEYIEKGYLTIDEIMGKYTPLSLGSWAYGVTKFMNQLR